MRAIVNTGPGRLEMLELPLPVPGAGQVRIHTGAVGICATDLAMVAGWERNGFPAIPGHEWAGTVDAVGEGVDASLVGKRCVAENVLADGLEVGFEHPGGYAEYLLTEAANVLTVPSDIAFPTLALIEPLAVSVHALHRLGEVVPGPVLIFGDGPIGLMLTLLMSRRGHYVVTVGGRALRLDIATEFGAASTLNYHEFDGDMVGEIKSRTGLEFPVVIEASGSGKAMDASLAIAAKQGKVLEVGDYGDTCPATPWNQMLWREVTLIGSNASAGAWPDAVRLAIEDRLPIDRLITHRLRASDFEEGYRLMRDRSSGVIKVTLEW